MGYTFFSNIQFLNSHLDYTEYSKQISGKVYINKKESFNFNQMGYVMELLTLNFHSDKKLFNLIKTGAELCSEIGILPWAYDESQKENAVSFYFNVETGPNWVIYNSHKDHTPSKIGDFYLNLGSGCGWGYPIGAHFYLRPQFGITLIPNIFILKGRFLKTFWDEVRGVKSDENRWDIGISLILSKRASLRVALTGRNLLIRKQDVSEEKADITGWHIGLWWGG